MLGQDGPFAANAIPAAERPRVQLKEEWRRKVDETRHFCLYRRVNSSQFRRYLAKQGCTFEEGKKHTLVYRSGRVAALPRHGGSKQLGTGLISAIKKTLDLE